MDIDKTHFNGTRKCNETPCRLTFSSRASILAPMHVMLCQGAFNAMDFFPSFVGSTEITVVPLPLMEPEVNSIAKQ